ncbi:hypothetical protein [Plantactinospora endophytica]|uniref:Uncharacterized protein n=1 Tax=Plantactinospora endophytica TaxID=673535 RepID=A0ABQ4E929_9ACTN|nr:hypothetical protein [Plantactinospora endophytica]GIG91240.1 hypothetical protein Pen02_61760 [Plantactinospora endophytica]
MTMRLGERIDMMVVTASTPDRSISAELFDRDQVVLRFEPGYYRRVDEHALENQLAALARILWAHRMREYYAILSDLADTQITGEPMPRNEAQVEFLERRDDITARGVSGDGRISISVTGMQQWKVHIQEGTLHRLPESGFTQAVREAVKQLLDDQMRQITVLKLELGERMG